MKVIKKLERYTSDSITLAYVDPQAFSLFESGLDESAQNELLTQITPALFETINLSTKPLYISRILQHSLNKFTVLFVEEGRSIQNPKITTQQYQEKIVVQSVEKGDQEKIHDHFLLNDQFIKKEVASRNDSLSKTYSKECEKFKALDKGVEVIEPKIPPKPLPPKALQKISLEDAYQDFNKKDACKKLTEEYKTLKHNTKEQLKSHAQNAILTLKPEIKEPSLKNNLLFQAFVEQVYEHTKKITDNKIDDYFNNNSDLEEGISALNELVKTNYQNKQEYIQLIQYYKESVIHAIYEAVIHFYVAAQKKANVKRGEIINLINSQFRGIITIAQNGIPEPINYKDLTVQKLSNFASFISQILSHSGKAYFHIEYLTYVSASTYVEQHLNKISQNLFSYDIKNSKFEWGQEIKRLLNKLQEIDKNIEEAIDILSVPDINRHLNSYKKIENENNRLVEDSANKLTTYQTTLDQALKAIGEAKKQLEFAEKARIWIVKIKSELEKSLTLHLDPIFDLIIQSFDDAKKQYFEMTELLTAKPINQTNPLQHSIDTLQQYANKAISLSEITEKIKTNLENVAPQYGLVQQKQIVLLIIIKTQQLLETAKKTFASISKINDEMPKELKINESFFTYTRQEFEKTSHSLLLLTNPLKPDNTSENIQAKINSQKNDANQALELFRKIEKFHSDLLKLLQIAQKKQETQLIHIKIETALANTTAIIDKIKKIISTHPEIETVDYQNLCEQHTLADLSYQNLMLLHAVDSDWFLKESMEETKMSLNTASMTLNSVEAIFEDFDHLLKVYENKQNEIEGERKSERERERQEKEVRQPVIPIIFNSIDSGGGNQNPGGDDDKPQPIKDIPKLPQRRKPVKPDSNLSFFQKHAGKFVGALIFSIAGAIAGALIGLVLAPLTFGGSIPVGIMVGIGAGIGAAAGGGLGILAGSVDDCHYQSTELDEIKHPKTLGISNTSDIYKHGLEAKPSKTVLYPPKSIQKPPSRPITIAQPSTPEFKPGNPGRSPSSF